MNSFTGYLPDSVYTAYYRSLLEAVAKKHSEDLRLLRLHQQQLSHLASKTNDPMVSFGGEGGGGGGEEGEITFRQGLQMTKDSFDIKPHVELFVVRRSFGSVIGGQCLVRLATGDETKVSINQKRVPRKKNSSKSRPNFLGTEFWPTFTWFLALPDSRTQPCPPHTDPKDLIPKNV